MGWDCGSRRPLPQSPAAVPTIRRLRNGKGCSQVTPLVDDRPKAASQKGPVLPKALPTLDATWPLTPPLHQDAPREHSGSGAPKPPSLRAGTGHPVHHRVPRPRAAPDSAGETSVGSADGAGAALGWGLRSPDGQQCLAPATYQDTGPRWTRRAGAPEQGTRSRVGRRGLWTSGSPAGPRRRRGNERGFWGMSPRVSWEPGGRCADRKQHELNSGRGHTEEEQTSPAPRAQVEAPGDPQVTAGQPGETGVSTFSKRVPVSRSTRDSHPSAPLPLWGLFCDLPLTNRLRLSDTATSYVKRAWRRPLGLLGTCGHAVRSPSPTGHVLPHAEQPHPTPANSQHQLAAWDMQPRQGFRSLQPQDRTRGPLSLDPGRLP